MKKMSPCELINQIQTREEYGKWFSFIPRLKLLSEKYPHILVGLYIDGDDWCDGETIAPITEDGDYDISKKRSLSPDQKEPFVFIDGD